MSISSQTVIHLPKSIFSEKEKRLVEHGYMYASPFLFSSGVAGLRIANRVGQLVMLPFQGQQIWDATFYGRSLTMRSMFDEPNPTTDYLHTYGGYLIHCGATAMGVPGDQDDHLVHGELPNAPYQSAQLIAGEDHKGRFIELSGRYRYTVAFNHNYVARPHVRLYENDSWCTVTLEIENLKRTPMELMYLAHINFRPVDNGQLIYSAKSDKSTVRVRRSIPGHIRPQPGYKAFLEELADAPERHHTLAPELKFDPEVVFFVDYLADEAGWAHTLQVHPDGTADFVRHRPAELDHGVRWISRTPDQDCIGIVLPATAEPEGYTAEKEKGNMKVIEPGGMWRTVMEIGMLTADETPSAVEKTKKIVDGAL